MYIDFLIIITYPYSSCICSFCGSIPTFCSFFPVLYISNCILQTTGKKCRDAVAKMNRCKRSRDK